MYLECLTNPLIYIILIHFQLEILLKINWSLQTVRILPKNHKFLIFPTLTGFYWVFSSGKNRLKPGGKNRPGFFPANPAYNSSCLLLFLNLSVRFEISNFYFLCFRFSPFKLSDQLKIIKSNFSYTAILLGGRN